MGVLNSQILGVVGRCDLERRKMQEPSHFRLSLPCLSGVQVQEQEQEISRFLRKDDRKDGGVLVANKTRQPIRGVSGAIHTLSHNKALALTNTLYPGKACLAGRVPTIPPSQLCNVYTTDRDTLSMVLRYMSPLPLNTHSPDSPPLQDAPLVQGPAPITPDGTWTRCMVSGIVDQSNRAISWLCHHGIRST